MLTLKNGIYRRFVTELQIGKIGGLFLALYKDVRIIEVIMDYLMEDLPNHFIFPIKISSEKVALPVIFEQAFKQIGRKSNLFHVIGIEDLSEIEKKEFFNNLQTARERFKAKHYSIIFWVKPPTEKEIFLLAPDFHHWVFGTYDFSKEYLNDDSILNAKVLIQKSKLTSLKNIQHYLEKVVEQYTQWDKVLGKKDKFLIEPMGRANLNNYYVQSYGIDQNQKTNLLDNILESFLSDKSKNLLTLLGDLGAGKTSFSVYYFVILAKKYLSNKDKYRIPIFISLKDYPGKLNIEDFIVKDFYDKFNIRLSYRIFQELALRGMFIFFIDGFDEMLTRSDQKITEDNFRELTKLSFENILFITNDYYERPKANKLFITCRTHYFLNEVQEQKILKAHYTILYKNYATRSNYDVTRLRIKDFNLKQITEYIKNTTTDQNIQKETISIIKDTYNLRELSTRPLLLDMIIKTIHNFNPEKEINVSVLYKTYTELWINRDDWRSAMKAVGKRNFMWQLALKMFNKGGDFAIHYNSLDLPQKRFLKKGIDKTNKDFYLYETTTCTFLNRDSSGNYKFIHKSFMEYFLAEYLYHLIKSNKPIFNLYRYTSEEIKFFLKQLISSDKINLSCMKLNGLNLKDANFKNGIIQNADLAGSDINRTNFENADLSQSNISRTMIEGANFKRANLYGVTLRAANTRGVIAESTSFNLSNLTDADLSFADLRGASFIGAKLNNANLMGTHLDNTDFTHADLKGIRHYKDAIWIGVNGLGKAKNVPTDLNL